MDSASPIYRAELSERECGQLFAEMYPAGPAGADVSAELVPEGWCCSPLFRTFHPSIDQVWRESLAMHENIERLDWIRAEKKKPHRKPVSPLTLEEVARDWSERPVDEVAELADLVGKCIWDVFSDNHDAVASDGRTVHLGSFRGSARFIAEWISEQLPRLPRDYLDYYKGSIWLAGRSSLVPVYRLIFRRLRAQDFDWRYSFPRLHLVRFEKPADLRHESYSPSEGFGRESERAKEEEEHERMVSQLREAETQERAEARDNPPPETVQAYSEVFRHWPGGWPP